MHRIVIAALALLSLGGTASAASLDGVNFPDRYPVNGQTLTLNGLGERTLTVFNVRIYVAGLYLAQPSHDAAAIMASTTPKVLVLSFLHGGSKAEVEKEYRAGEAQNCSDGSCAATNQTDFEKLVAAAPAVKVGDTTTYVFTQRGVRVLANNQVIGDYANPDLANHLLAGFIGAHPPSAPLRSALLGNGSN